MKTRFTIGVVIIISSVLLNSQTGSWNPPNLDSANPRTLLRQTDVNQVISSLSSYPYNSLFDGVYQNASLSAAQGTTDTDRLLNSHIAKNAAFAALLGKKSTAGVIYTLTEEEKQALINKVITILEAFPTDVDRITVSNPSIYDSWQWRSKELIDFCVAYDLLKGTGVTDIQLAAAKTRIQEFTAHLYEESTRLIMPPMYPISFFDVVMNNHAVMTASALGMAAVVLYNASSDDPYKQPINWINAAMWHLDNLLFVDANRQSEPDAIGGYAEGPAYFRYGMLNCLPFMRAMGYFIPAGSLSYTYNTVTRSIPNPYYDARYDSLFAWVARIRMPDGRLPAIEDSHIYYYFPELAISGKSQYVWQNSFSRMKTENSLTMQLTGSNTDMRANYLASLPVNGANNDSLMQALPAAGDLVFRSSTDSNAVYMHVTGKHGVARSSSFGHNQADVSSFLIYKGGELLALDPGYLNYSRRNETGNAVNHNMILVDGAGPAIGDPQYSNDADGYVENTMHRARLDYGEIRTSYSGADITRSFLFVRKKYFINADTITSSASHNYTWQLHGYGIEGGTVENEGTFTADFTNSRGIWAKGSQSLLVFSTARGGVDNYSKISRPHEYTYDSVSSHTTMQAEKNSANGAQFLSVLHPYESTPVQVSSASSSPIAVLKVIDDVYNDIVFAQSGTEIRTIEGGSSALPLNLNSNGSLTFYSINSQSGSFDQFYAKNCTLLTYGSSNIFTSDNRVNAALQMNGPYTLTGYISGQANVTLYAGQHVAEVTGTNVNSWTWQGQGYINISFSGNSYFTIITSEPLPVELKSFSAERTAEGIKLKWTTVSELNSHRFDVERSADKTGWVRIASLPGAGNSSSKKEYSVTDNYSGSSAVKYRLKLVDVDGSYRFSPEVFVESTVPAECALLQNYPNPFNPSTVITCKLKEFTRMRLSVFDALGKELAVIADEITGPGIYNYIFDATPYASGVYFYRLKTNAGTITNKMIIQK